MVNLEWYRTFKAIYQYGTLTRASQELMVSQPNMSIQLASLESYIGKPLFVRMPRKMMPTEYGKQLYTQIVESIDNLERVESEFKRTVISKVPNIRFGTPAELFRNFLANHIADQKDLHLTVEYGLAEGLINRLLDNNLDIAIITKPSRKSEDNLTYEPLFSESFFIVCNIQMDTSKFDEYIASGNISDVEKWLKSKKWYAYEGNLPLIRRFWKENFKKRPLVSLKGIIPDQDAILRAVANSDCLAASSNLIANTALKDGDVKILWKGEVEAQNTLYIAYNKDKIQPLYVKMIKDFVLQNTVFD